MKTLIRNRDNIKNTGEVFTPTHIVDLMLDMIPASVWRDPNVVFIEPTCGNGQFVERIAVRRLDSGIDPNTVNQTLIALDISDENVQDTINRLRSVTGVGDHSVYLVNDSLEVIGDPNGILSRYDLSSCVVVGNPPYQAFDTNSTMAKPIYHLFVEKIIDELNPLYFSFITPSRWMLGGKGLDAHRVRMMSDKRLRKIVHFKNPRHVFPDVGIAGGVNYFLWDRSYSGMCEFTVGDTCTTRYLDDYDIIVQDNNAFDIINKVVGVDTPIAKSCTSSNPFGLRANYSGFVDSGIPCVCQGKSIKHVSGFTDRYGIIDKWKVVIGRVTSEGNIKETIAGYVVVLTNFFIIEPGSVCLDTYIVVKSFDSKGEADNFIGYMSTKFFRFMLYLRVSGIDLSKDKFAWIPDLGRYDTPITDAMLYDEYRLSDVDVEYIEKRIRIL